MNWFLLVMGVVIVVIVDIPFYLRYKRRKMSATGLRNTTTKLYKLTDERGKTRNNTQWGKNVTHEAPGKDAVLCTDTVIHAYEHPLLAVFFNEIHVSFAHPRLWEASGDVVIRDGQVKCGCKRMTTIREIQVPDITPEQKVEIAVRLAKQVVTNKEWNDWADEWLSGRERTGCSVYSVHKDVEEISILGNVHSELNIQMIVSLAAAIVMIPSEIAVISSFTKSDVKWMAPRSVASVHYFMERRGRKLGILAVLKQVTGWKGD